MKKFEDLPEEEQAKLFADRLMHCINENIKGRHDPFFDNFMEGVHKTNAENNAKDLNDNKNEKQPEETSGELG